VDDRPAARADSVTSKLPVPPLEYRRIVGRTDEHFYDGSTPEPLFAGLDVNRFHNVLDFGCGAGRLAGDLMRRGTRRYLGIDRHPDMIDWCRANLTPLRPGFAFAHHDVFHPVLNPHGSPGHLPLPCADRDVTLFIAISVFTHLLEEDAAFYLRELGRVLALDGTAVTTWFLFDKRDFPMMQEFQNALMINPCDLTNAVIFDRDWMVKTAADADLLVTKVEPPTIRGFHWSIQFERRAPGRSSAVFPLDLAPPGLSRPPLS
jgi:SAM-dependent methyltransferase